MERPPNIAATHALPNLRTKRASSAVILATALFAAMPQRHAAAEVEHPHISLAQGAQGRSIGWNGKPGDTYFVQWSWDLRDWFYYPIIYPGDGSPVVHKLESSSANIFTRLRWTDQPHDGDPHSRDFDDDGLSSIEELTNPIQTDPLNPDSDGDLLRDGWELEYGFAPNNPDMNGDGILDGLEDPDGDGADNVTEQFQHGNPHDAIDGGMPPLEVVGSQMEGVESVESRSYYLPPGSRSYLVVAYLNSDEYPMYTSIASPFDDVMRWHVQISNAEDLTGSVSVNTLHDQWLQSEADGTGLPDYTPVAAKVLGVVHGSAQHGVSVDVELAITNVRDGDLWTRAMVGMIPFEITPDWNRDGIINQTDRNHVTKDKPWRWWMNDDDDKPLSAGAWDGSGDTPTGGWGDSHDSEVDGIRDLVDFFPLHVDLRDLLRRFSAEHHHYRLRHPDGALKYVDVPFVNPRAAFGAASHLINVETAGYLKRETSHRTTNEGGSLSEEFLEAAKQGRGMILCEGSNISDKPLYLEIRTKKGELLAAIDFPLRISRVEEMYRHLNVRDQLARDEDKGDRGSLDTQLADPGDPYPDELTNGQYFVFVHGYNIDAYHARGWHSEIFKRMHQMGSKARFVGVSWYGDTGTDYHHAVHHAFLTGDILNDQLDLDGDMTIAGHSLGNMVVSHAIEYGGLEPKRYYMLNAATPVEAYDPNQTQGADGRLMENFMTEKSWKPLRAHRKKLFASDWYRLFEANDGRSKLTWNGRFARKVPLVATNFYSTGEDVVANPREEESVTIHLRDAILSFNLSMHAWVGQEIAKGSDFMGLVLKDTHAGWAENEGCEQWQAIKAQDNWQQHIDELVTERLVREHPFYEVFGQPDLYNPAKGSAEGNKKEVQYRLLASAIPAKSFAVAANPVDALTKAENLNIDMMGLKTDGDWPRGNDEKDNHWLHSDFRNVALCYVHKMWSKMIQIENLDDN